MVYCNGELEPRIVIKQENGSVDGQDSNDPNNDVSNWNTERFLERLLRGTLTAVERDGSV